MTPSRRSDKMRQDRLASSANRMPGNAFCGRSANLHAALHFGLRDWSFAKLPFSYNREPLRSAFVRPVCELTDALRNCGSRRCPHLNESSTVLLLHGVHKWGWPS